MKVLLVDDLDANRLTLGALLEADGHVVVEAATLKEATGKLLAEPPDAVLLDLGLPDGDGRALIPVARRFPGTRVILLTGADVSEALAQQADGVLKKGEAYEKLARMLEGK